MQYTLDSVVQFEACLDKLYPSSTYNREPIYIEDLSQLTLDENSFYFGVLTVGSNVITAVLKNSDDNEVITIETNSQIIEAFKSVDFLDVDTNPLPSPVGQFRGFQITIK